jgi:hypothetical protein
MVKSNKKKVLKIMPKMAEKPIAAKKKKEHQAGEKKKGLLPAFVMANINPFDDKVLGVKVPDSSTMPSGTAYSFDRVTLSTDATYGGAVMAFRYHPKAYRVGASGMATASTWTWVASFGNSASVSNLTGLTGNFTAVRTVAWGLKIRSRVNANIAQGAVHICYVPENFNAGVSTWNYPLSISAMSSLPGYKAINLQDLLTNEHTAPGLFTDETAFRYMDPATFEMTTPTTMFPTSGWATILVAIEGLATGSSVAAVDIDVVHHYEALPGPTASVVPLTPAAPHSPAVLAGAKYAASNEVSKEGIRDTGSPGFFNDVVKAFEQGIMIANGARQIYSLLSPIALF